MAKRYLASVGVGTLLARKSGELVPVARVNTLTESTLSITSTMEEVRAGQGAKLYGRFNHDSGMTVTLTDAMFDLNYIALQVGAEIQTGGIKMYTETVNCTEAGVLNVSRPIDKIGESCGLDHYLVWYREAGCEASEEYKSAEADVGAWGVSGTDAEVGKTYCVSYFTTDLAASTVLISANFVPAELVLILTTKLYAGDANAPETGKPVGEITIKIPRFQLDGAFDLSMAMSAAASMSLNGTALAVSDGGCEDNGIYAEIVEVVDGVKWFETMNGLLMDSDGDGEYDGTTDEGTAEYTMAVADAPVGKIFNFYATFSDKTPVIVPVAQLTLDPGETGIGFDALTGAITKQPTAGTVIVKLDPNAADNAGLSEEQKAYAVQVTFTA